MKLFPESYHTEASKPYATFSYHLNLDENKLTADAVVELTFHVSDEKYSAELSGEEPLYINKLTKDITIIEGGPLEGYITLGETEYEIMTSFQKRIGQSGACLGLSMKPVNSEEFPVFLRLGQSVYTDEVRAVHPMYAPEAAQINEGSDIQPRFSAPATPDGFTRALNNYTIAVPSNPYVSGTGMHVYVYYKTKGTSSSTGANTDFNLVSVASYSNCDELSDSVKLANVYLTRFSLTSSAERDFYFERFYDMPAPSSSKGKSFFDILIGALTVLGIYKPEVGWVSAGLELLKNAVPSNYTSSISSDGTESTFELSVRTDTEVKFDTVPAAVTYQMRSGETGNYNIAVKPSFQYKYLSYETVHFFTVSGEIAVPVKCVI